MAAVAVGVFVEVVDRLIEILKARKRKKRELFDEVIEPTFAEVQCVVEAYFVFFSRARQGLERAERQSDYRLLVKDLSDKRRDFQAVRLKIAELTKALRAKARAEPVRHFAEAVDELFEATLIKASVLKLPAAPTPQVIRRGASARSALLDRIDFGLRDSKRALLSYCDERLEKLEAAFTRVAGHYATLRLHSLV